MISLEQEKALDQEKAFDRVDWSFLQRVLAKMNFGTSFCLWVQLLYTNIYSQVIVNHYLGDSFPISHGVRQGCPLSPLLYILVAETIASVIQQDPHIDGYETPQGSTVKLFQYADDTTPVIISSNASLTQLFSIFDRYERASGAKLNVYKSHGLPFGTWHDRRSFPVPLLWSNASISILVCRIGAAVLPIGLVLFLAWKISWPTGVIASCLSVGAP